MPMVFAPRLAQLVMLMTMGGGVGLPLGIPPAPEEPVVSAMAPEECLCYLNWAGIAKPDPASRNQTEQLLAEKEVQDCLRQFEERILDMARREAQRDPQASAMVEPIATVLKAVLTSPTALYISRFDPSGREGGFRAGAMVNLGQRAATVEQALAKIEEAMAEGEAKPPAEPSRWRRLALGPDGLAAEWAIKDKYLFVGVGEGEADRIVAQAGQKPPAWLTQIRRRLAVPRPSSLVYVNLSAILKAAGPQLPSDGRSLLEALGLSRVQYLASLSGLDDSGCISKTQIAVDGNLRGLLSLCSGEPLAKQDLAVIPRDATLAVAARLDLAKAYQEFLETLGRVEPRGREELLGSVGQLEAKMKLNLSKDVFESVGDAWRVYNSPTEGGLVVTGLTAVVDLRDRDRLVAANGKLVLSSLVRGAAKEFAGQGATRRGTTISQFKFGENTIFHLKSGDRGMPFAPAWCITEKELVVALYPQNVKAYLTRASGSLAEMPAVAGLFDGKESATGMAYCNAPELFKLTYPILQLLAQAACSELQRQDVDFDISLLPSALSINRHLQPSVTSLRRNESGIVVETRQTLPVGPGGLMLPWIVFASPRSLRLANFPTAQSASTNNLKQIALGLHNYHDTMKSFPAAAGPKKPGQPPVSWRVLILPYMGAMPIYNQYRFDEPWDSENNKKLIAQMPPVYKAPGSKVAAQGKTNYLAVVGNEYAFAANEGRSFREFTDGTSNTILVVEADDERAVPWTKPEDFTPDKTNPVAGLVGLRPGGFLVGISDGSVQRLPAGIDAAALNALFTRAGGEPALAPDEARGATPPRPRPMRKAPPSKVMIETKPAARNNRAPAAVARVPLVPVRGTIAYQGMPVEGANVVYLPRQEDAPVAAGRTDATGKFTLTTFTSGDGARPGQYTVTISKLAENDSPTASPRPLPPGKYSEAQSSGLTASVSAAGPNDFTFELTD